MDLRSQANLRRDREALLSDLDSGLYRRIVTDYLREHIQSWRVALLTDESLSEARRVGLVLALRALKEGLTAPYDKEGLTVPDWLAKEFD